MLLGFCMAPKDYKGLPCAKLSFELMKLAGEFYQPSNNVTDSRTLVQQLRQSQKLIRPVLSSHKTKYNIFVHLDLSYCNKISV